MPRAATAVPMQPAIQPALLRLTLALGASALLHFWLVYAVAIDVRTPDRAAPVAGAIDARLEPRRVEPAPVEAIVVNETLIASRTQAPARIEARSARRQNNLPDVAAHVPSAPVEHDKPVVALSAPPLADPTYYPVASLDRLPRELTRVQPVFPEDAATAGVQRGEVTLMLMIEENGGVSDARVVDAKPQGHFERSALAWALERARFAPAQRNGRDVKARVLVKVDYALETPVANK